MAVEGGISVGANALIQSWKVITCTPPHFPLDSQIWPPDQTGPFDGRSQIASMTPLLLIMLLGFVCASPPTEVVVLTDSTFEHDTQAATGQTTGVW